MIPKPCVIQDPDRLADQAKYCYFTDSELLAQMQHRLAELAGAGKIDRDISDDLQRELIESAPVTPPSTDHRP